MTVSGSVSQPWVSFKDVTWSFRYQGLKNTILRPCVLRLIVHVCKYSLLTHLHVQNISFLSARQQFFCPLFQPLSAADFIIEAFIWGHGSKQHHTTLSNIRLLSIPAEPLWERTALASFSFYSYFKTSVLGFHQSNVNQTDFVSFYLFNQIF